MTRNMSSRALVPRRIWSLADRLYITQDGHDGIRGTYHLTHGNGSLVRIDYAMVT